MHIARSQPDRLFLVGPMGSGKTTLGRRAAEQLGLTFIDCDEEIERRKRRRIRLAHHVVGGVEDVLAARLREGDHYEVDEKKRQVVTTEGGVTRVERP